MVHYFSSLKDPYFLTCIEYFYIPNLKYSHVFLLLGMLIKE